MKEVSSVDWAYLAGFLDGDGSFYLSFSWTGKTKSGRKKRFIRPCISISQIDRNILIDLSEKFGGRVYGPTRNNEWQLIFYRRPELIWLCFNLIPFLKLKKEHAKLLKRFLENRQNNFGKYTEEDLMLAKRLRSLNTRKTWRRKYEI